MERLKIPKRRLIESSLESLVYTRSWENKSMPILISPRIDGLELIQFSSAYREQILKNLYQAGALLFRDFKIKGAEHFVEFTRTLSGMDLLSYKNRSTPRSHLGDNIYTSTEYPADQTILQHNENSYSHNWPMKIWFHCEEPATEGGSTPISDSRKVFKKLDPTIRKTFENKKVMYVRNYGKLDLPWEDVFQTNSKDIVEQYCKQHGMEFSWKKNGDLQTKQVRQAVIAHPITQEMVWFNQAHLFHITALEPETYESLRSSIPEDEWPRNTYFGDGSSIDPLMLQEIRNVYEDECIDFQWRKDDVLMLDNILTAHGRRPYKGHRKVLVGMAESHSIQ